MIAEIHVLITTKLAEGLVQRNGWSLWHIFSSETRPWLFSGVGTWPKHSGNIALLLGTLLLPSVFLEW